MKTPTIDDTRRELSKQHEHLERCIEEITNKIEELKIERSWLEDSAASVRDELHDLDQAEEGADFLGDA